MIAEEHGMIVDLVERFVRDELMPLEPVLIAREAEGGRWALTSEESEHLHERARTLGLWGLNAPEEYGGADLPESVMARVHEALGRVAVPFVFPPDSPNLVMLASTGTPEQKEKYLKPYVEGRTISAICISEPGAGGDPSGMTTRAVREGDDYVLNGRKIWISRAPVADFTIAIARVGDGKRHEGMTAFIIDKGTPGYNVQREIRMLSGLRTYEVLLEDCRVPASQVLGTVGAGFAPMQLRLITRRLEMAAMCVGIAGRALDMMIDHTRERVTFGQTLSERQAIQWWVADAATKIHLTRLLLQDIAAKVERGEDVRLEASMAKVYATEMAYETVDHAMQSFGAMGMTKELPLHLLSERVRTMRVYEGPSEVHRMTIAKHLYRR